MTLLHFRPWTRAALLQAMNGDCGGIELGEDEDAPEGQAVEDVLLGVAAGDVPLPAGLVKYHRSEVSTVWHWRLECPAFPSPEQVVWGHLGEPALGLKCRECWRLELATSATSEPV